MIQTHRYETVGTYKVLLTVTDGSGKQATFVGDVKVAVPEIPK
jgi:PKD repeat protein